MERMLKKMAEKLNSYDEASLMNLWGDYAQRVQSFEPGKNWEEAVLIFCMIQSVSWKNQLFNYHLAESYSPSDMNGPDFQPFIQKYTTDEILGEMTVESEKTIQPKATVLQFPSKK